VLDHADYIADMGFTAVWLTPVMENPDQAFRGGEPIAFGGTLKDGGKTGYHGYWSVNFFREDEHWVSSGLDFEVYAEQMRERGFKVVFDIVANHGSPSFSMPEDQPLFGELYDAEGRLVADHENRLPEALDPENPLHQFFRREQDFVQLSNLNDENPMVIDYLVEAYLGWIEKGADAFRIDTIQHVPHRFWKIFSDRIREKHPDFFMFGESFNFDANAIAQHTLEKNGGVSVLDFPGREAMTEVFEIQEAEEEAVGFEKMKDYLHLTHGPYTNPYDLVTFYDNHDMARLNADANGFIDAHHWLFTARGIPCVYYGSEIGFMAGKKEHEGNRNYFGKARIAKASEHTIYQSLKEVAQIRQDTPALQRGLQLNVKLEGDEAIFYRVIQHEAEQQIALVFLNKGEHARQMQTDAYLQSGEWTERTTGNEQLVSPGKALNCEVPAHGVRVWVLNETVTREDLKAELHKLMRYK